ncbi:hypothetical protein PTTG_12095 [Puccinia triticina 1-1 BBBD Race 1]|uniref:Uncharacterized protein n=1 Tax=Puccinia triticina (isolate 1-1 / race 1 (BBBD)) TaxID=630390 RepID=A0A180GHV4_PUCT1|nr:hypothetical protein PTTG_12095 [Puccinia triticina 1-1 BBBD Race 1]
MLDRLSNISLSSIRPTLSFSSMMNVMKSFIVLVFDYFLIHILVITVGSTSADSPSNRSTKSPSSGGLPSCQTYALTKRSITGVLDACDSSQAAPRAALHTDARVAKLPDVPKPAELAAPKGRFEFDGDHKSEELSDEEVILANNLPSPTPVSTIHKIEPSVDPSIQCHWEDQSGSSDFKSQKSQGHFKARWEEIVKAQNSRPISTASVNQEVTFKSVQDLKLPFEIPPKPGGNSIANMEKPYSIALKQLRENGHRWRDDWITHRPNHPPRNGFHFQPRRPGIKFRDAWIKDLEDEKPLESKKFIPGKIPKSSIPQDRLVEEDTLIGKLSNHQEKEHVNTQKNSRKLGPGERVGQGVPLTKATALLLKEVETKPHQPNPIVEKVEPAEESNPIGLSRKEEENVSSKETGRGTRLLNEIAGETESENSLNTVEIKQDPVIEKEVAPSRESPNQQEEKDPKPQETGIQADHGSGVADEVPEKEEAKTEFHEIDIEEPQPNSMAGKGLTEENSSPQIPAEDTLNVANPPPREMEESSAEKDDEPFTSPLSGIEEALARKDDIPSTAQEGHENPHVHNREIPEVGGSGLAHPLQIEDSDPDPNPRDTSPRTHQEAEAEAETPPQMQEFYPELSDRKTDRDLTPQDTASVLRNAHMEDADTYLPGEPPITWEHQQPAGEPPVENQDVTSGLKASPLVSQKSISLSAAPEVHEAPASRKDDSPTPEPVAAEAEIIEGPFLPSFESHVDGNAHSFPGTQHVESKYLAENLGSPSAKGVEGAHQNPLRLLAQSTDIPSLSSESLETPAQSEKTYDPTSDSDTPLPVSQTDEFSNSVPQAHADSTPQKVAGENSLTIASTRQVDAEGTASRLSLFSQANQRPSLFPSSKPETQILGGASSIRSLRSKTGRLSRGFSRLRPSGSQKDLSKTSGSTNLSSQSAESQIARRKPVGLPDIVTNFEQSVHTSPNKESQKNLNQDHPKQSEEDAGKTMDSSRMNLDASPEKGSVSPLFESQATKDMFSIPQGLKRIIPRKREEPPLPIDPSKPIKDVLEAFKKTHMYDSPPSSPVDGIKARNSPCFSVLKNSPRGSPRRSGPNSPSKRVGFMNKDGTDSRTQVTKEKSKFYVEAMKASDGSSAPPHQPPVVDAVPHHQKSMSRAKSAYIKVSSPRIGGLGVFDSRMKLERAYSVNTLDKTDLSSKENAFEGSTPREKLKPLNLMLSMTFRDKPRSRRPRQRVPYYRRKADIIADKKRRPPLEKSKTPRKPRSSTPNHYKDLPAIRKSDMNLHQAKVFIRRLRRFTWKQVIPVLFTQPNLKVNLMYHGSLLPINYISQQL